MAEQQIIARFQADVSDLEKGVARAQASIASVPVAVEKSNNSAIKSQRNLKKSIGEVGQAVRAVAPAVGGVAGEFVLLAGTATSSLKTVAAAVISLAGPGGVVGLIAAGVGAAIFGLHQYGQAAKQAKAETLALELSVGKLQTTLTGLGNASKARLLEIAKLTLAIEESERAIALLKANPQFKQSAQRLQGEERNKAQLESQLNAARFTEDVNKLVIAETRAKIVAEEYARQLRALNLDVENGGDVVAFYAGRLQAAEENHRKLLEIEGVAPELIEESNKAIRDATAALEEEERAWKAVQQAREDASIPTGSGTAVEQPTGILEQIAGAQTAIQDLTSDLDRLDAAFARVMGSIGSTADAIAEGVSDTFHTLARGVAAALVAAIQGTGDAAQILAGIFNQIATAIIAKIIEVFIIEAAIEKTKIILKSIGAYASIPFVGLALGIAAAGAAIAAARGLAGSEGGRAFAQGGVVLGPTLGLVGEAGPEVVLPLKNSTLEKFGLGGGGETTIHNVIHLDGRKVAESVTRHQPGVIRRKLGPIF